MALNPFILVLMATSVLFIKAGLVKDSEMEALEAELQELYNSNGDIKPIEVMEERLSDLYNKEEERQGLAMVQPPTGGMVMVPVVSPKIVVPVKKRVTVRKDGRPRRPSKMPVKMPRTKTTTVVKTPKGKGTIVKKSKKKMPPTKKKGIKGKEVKKGTGKAIKREPGALRSEAGKLKAEIAQRMRS
jgi:hypothetical protein